MVRGIHKLTERACAGFIRNCIRTRKRGVINDGGGLYCNVGDGGTASWIFRYQRDGRRHDMGLGAVHTINLAEAREAAHLARQQLHRGEDPLAMKRRAKRAQCIATPASKLFRDCVKTYLDVNQAKWSAKTYKDTRNSLATYADPIIGNKLICDITREDVLAVLRPCWKTKTETMDRVHGRIEAVLGWAIAKGYRAAPNPAQWKDNLDADLSKKDRSPQEHLPAIDYKEVPALINDLQADPGLDAKALQFAFYCTLRDGTLRGIQWPHIKLASQSMLLPAAIMKVKSRGDFRVPLSPPMMAILEELAAVRTSNPYVFAGQRGGQLSEKAMRQALKRHRPDVEATVHGSTRAAFSTWRGDETQFAEEVAEACLAHAKSDKVAAAYNRGDLFNKRRQLMVAWAEFCSGGNVVTLRRSA